MVSPSHVEIPPDEKSYTISELTRFRDLLVMPGPAPAAIQFNVNTSAQSTAVTTAHQTIGPPVINKSDRQAAQIIRNSAWISGSFYLLALVILLIIFLVIGHELSIWFLPVIIIGAALLLCLIGALQLRNDDKLSEENFLKLMLMVFRELPLIRSVIPDNAGENEKNKL